MNEQDILNHLRNRIPQTMLFGDVPRGGGLLQRLLAALLGGKLSGIGQKIIDALKELLGQSGFTLEMALEAAKRYYDEFTAGDNPGIPNFWESLIESLGWMAIERAIRRMFASQPIP